MRDIREMKGKQYGIFLLKGAFTSAALGRFVWSAYSFFLFAVFTAVFSYAYARYESAKKSISTTIIAGVLAGFLSFGRQPSGIMVLDYFVVWCGSFFLFDLLLTHFYSFLDRSSLCLSALDKRKVNGSIFFALTFGTALVFWGIYFAVFYPGLITNDSYTQLYQAVGAAPYSNHHPWIHTLLIKLFYELGFAFTHSIQTAVAVYTLAQMIILAGIYSYVLTFFYKKGLPAILIFILYCFYILFPVNAMYAVYIGKDNIFSAIVLVFVVLLWDMYLEYREKNYISKRMWIIYSVTGFFLCTFRSNGWYAFILCIPFIIYCFREIWRKAALSIGIVVLAVVIFKGPIMSAYSVSSPDLLESLAIPMQQIAGTIKEKGPEALTDEEYGLLEEIIDVEQIPDIYFCQIADPIKNAIRQNGTEEYLRSHLLEYFKLYISLGLRYPGEYIRAFIWQTQGYYAPNVRYWVNHYPYVYADTVLGIEPHSLLPEKIAERVRLVSADYPDVWGYRSLWYIGTYVWSVVIALGYGVSRKANILPFIPIIAIWCTLLIASPVHAEFRYAYPIVISAPSLACIVLRSVKKTEP